MNKFLLFLAFFLLSCISFGQTKVVFGNANLRTSPEIKDNIICVIPGGTTVTIVPENPKNPNWSKIKYSGKTGYVNNDLLKNEYKEKKVINSAPAGATAECNDGTYSYSKSRRGTCSHHGGIKRWL